LVSMKNSSGATASVNRAFSGREVVDLRHWQRQFAPALHNHPLHIR
jgi:hypothetical protein